MSTELAMPKLGEVMEEGKVVAWRKKEGDAVAKGEILLEVETDKAVMEIESTASGILSRIIVPAGATVPVNSSLAIIE